MAEILLYGIVGDPVDKLDARTVTGQIRAATGDLTVRINSPGGFVMEGLAIYEALASYDRGQVIIHIDALAASMASGIAMAGDKIIMAETAFMMIHRPWDAAIGDADEMRKAGARLDKIETQLVGIYARRTGLAEAAVSAMLEVETWFTAEEAIAAGFADETTEPLKLAAMADLSAFGFRSSPDKSKDKPVTTTAKGPLNAAEVTEIRALVAAHKLPDSVALDIFQGNMPMNDARAHVLEKLAERQESEPVGFRGIDERDQTFNNPAFAFNAMADALYARMSGTAPKDAARDVAGMSMIDMARDILDRHGVRGTRGMAPIAVLRAFDDKRPFLASSKNAITHGTGDFPDLLQSTGLRFLIDQYKLQESGLKKLGRRVDAKDFRSRTGVVLSEFTPLDQVNELGELKQGTFTSRSESYKLNTFGKTFSLSRQAMINDDLGAFRDPLVLMARAAAESEATLLSALLNSNPTMSDGNALFSAAHGNLVTPGTAPTVAAVDAMRVKLGSQKDPNGGQYLEIRPDKWLGPIALGGQIRVTNGSQYDPDIANKLQRANIALGLLSDIIDTPRLTDQNAWYLFANPELYPVLEYAYLNGEENPHLDSKEGWAILGMEFRIYHDFGAGFVDWRGAVKNAGV